MIKELEKKPNGKRVTWPLSLLANQLARLQAKIMGLSAYMRAAISILYAADVLEGCSSRAPGVNTIKETFGLLVGAQFGCNHLNGATFSQGIIPKI